MRSLLAAAFLALALSGKVAWPAANLVPNGDLEAGLAGWRPVWSRQPGAGTLTLDRETVHGGNAAARIEHRGAEDWSFEPDRQVAVQAGDIFELSAWIRLTGPGSATVCVSTWDAQGRNVSWSYGDATTRAGTNWTRLARRFAVPPGVTQLQPRVIGYGAATVWVDDYSLVPQPGVSALRRPDTPPELALTNATLEVHFKTADATFSVRDRRTGRTWSQTATHLDTVVTAARLDDRRIELDLIHAPSGSPLRGRLELEAARPELTFALEGDCPLAAPLRFPHPFASAPGDRLVVPMNEGISYPVEDASVETFRLVAYGGHGICMAFWGVTDDRQGHAAILETPDDAAIQLARVDRRLVIAPEWDAQRGQLGYPRMLRYVFFDQGGHVAIAKRYRDHARAKGLLRTLADKRRETPDVDLLVGAVNVWNWDADPVALVTELQAAGIERILWSRGGPPAALRALNERRVLTSRYDIYQDVMDPANFPFLRGVHADWTTAAWPQDILRHADGDWARGWEVQGTNGTWYPCGVICDRRALDYARQRIPAELATHPYRCRFIDTTTAAPWHECYDPIHPMTRTESRVWKMKLLEYVSREARLVTGCETGHDAAVPYLHYFEGMLSLGPYRVPDAGRDMARLWTQIPDVVAKYQVGQTYRLPLWELVYHDCVVAQWYWGDYNNKLPALWDKRDLFNLLYGTPPMFMFNRALWRTEQARFVRSYRNTSPYVRAVGYAEMTDHRFLTPDRQVQQTRFANGVTITVNFGDAPYRPATGEPVGPMGFRVDGLPSTAP